MLKRWEIEGASNMNALSTLNKFKAMKKCNFETHMSKKGAWVGDYGFWKGKLAKFLMLSENSKYRTYRDCLYSNCSDNYGLSPSEYRRMFIELPLSAEKL